MKSQNTGQKQGRHGRRRYKRQAVAAVVVAGLSLTGPATAFASAAGSCEVGVTHTLHFFSKSVDIRFTTATGKPFDPSRDPFVAGDQVEETDLDYVGNHLRHARSWTASDHLLCVFNTKTVPVCDGQIARGGSMILLRGTVDTSSENQRYRISGGTGTFRGAIGTLVSAGYSSDSENSDLTVSWHHR